LRYLRSDGLANANTAARAIKIAAIAFFIAVPPFGSTPNRS
jgi:hypothetical protein